eukprot:jgi/Botrbrau1/23434/Bobra.0570s0001.1
MHCNQSPDISRYLLLHERICLPHDKTPTACAMSGLMVLAMYSGDPLSSLSRWPEASGVPAPTDSPSLDSGLLLATKSLDIGVSTPRPSSHTPLPTCCNTVLSPQTPFMYTVVILATLEMPIWTTEGQM